MLTNPPVLYDFCVGDPNSRLLTVESMPVQHSVLNVKVLEGEFNQEKALVGAISVIVQLRRLIVYSSSIIHSNFSKLSVHVTLVCATSYIGGNDRSLAEELLCHSPMIYGC